MRFRAGGRLDRVPASMWHSNSSASSRTNTAAGDRAMSASNSIALHVHLACIWEATARKPGNVHRYHDFADAGYLDYLLSAAAIAPVLDRAPDWRVGET